MKAENTFIDIITEHLKNEETVLPPFSRTALRIQREVAKAEPSAAAIEKLIFSDQSLTGQVLRAANSSFFKGLTKTATVHDAIVRLGVKEIANIVTLVSQKKNFRARHPVLNGLMATLWRHSVGCAIGSHFLATRCGFGPKSQEAFTAGLLHDMGKLFVLTVLESLTRSGRIKNIPDRPLLAEIMASLHAQCGFELLQKWNLPEIYCRVARDHHAESAPSHDELLLLVRLANQACNKLGIGLHGDSELLLAATPEADQLGLSEIFLAELEIKLEDSIAFAA